MVSFGVVLVLGVFGAMVVMIGTFTIREYGEYDMPQTSVYHEHQVFPATEIIIEYKCESCGKQFSDWTWDYCSECDGEVERVEKIKLKRG